MKKLRFLVIFLFLIYRSVDGQIAGDGSLGNPYTGGLATGSFVVSGNKYFDAITVSGGTLTISAGSNMFASNMAAFIVVSGSGALIADGSEGSLITFTADHDGDGISGSTETWRNILFDEFSSGTSLIDNAIIEKGTGDDYFYGGGIDIWGGNVTISNSTIRNCKNEYANGGGIAVTPSGLPVSLMNLKIYNNIAAGVGGGIFSDGNVTISNCEVYNNTASNGAGIYLNGAGSISNSIVRDHSGEGVYSFGSDASGSITNCIIYNNGLGVYLYGERDIVNSTFVNNATGIASASGASPKVVNTILWGNTTQYRLESGASLELANCGIQGGFTVGTDGGGNKNLSSINGADTGPNFVSAANDFHLNSWITPLVDGGATSYTGVVVPGTDKEGKSRIRALDIGAFEFTYYVWTGSASEDWATPGNWVGSPSSIPTLIVDNKVIIPKGCPYYPTVASLSLSTRSNVTVEPQAGLKVTGATTVGADCTFLLESDATGSANFITGPTLSGNFTVEMFLSGGGDPNFKWHYIATPVHGISKNAVTTNIGNPNNLLNYNEAIVTTDKMAGWNWHDGFSGSTIFTTLLNTFGYNVYVPTDQTAVFNGAIKIGTTFTNTNITYSSATLGSEISGWNLIGNPFTSTVDINQFIFSLKMDLDWTVYFTRNNQFCSWSKAGNAGINGATRYMPPLQGFFVHARASGTVRSVQIPAAARMYSTTNSLYKKGALSETEIKEIRTNPYLKFNVSDGVSLTDESIIYFFDDATNGFDSEYDAYKLMSNNPAHPQIYSINTENTELGLNALPVPTGITTVPLKLRIGVEKNYTINVLDLQNLDACKVTLIHGTNRIDLKANPTYTFSASSGTISNMSIEFDNLITSDIIPAADKETFCWYSNNKLFIKSNLARFETGSDLSIYDLNGNIVFSKNKLSIIKDGISEFPLNLPAGLYIVTLNNNNLRVNKKVVIAD